MAVNPALFLIRKSTFGKGHLLTLKEMLLAGLNDLFRFLGSFGRIVIFGVKRVQRVLGVVLVGIHVFFR